MQNCRKISNSSQPADCFFQKTTMFGFDTGLVTASALDTLK